MQILRSTNHLEKFLLNNEGHRGVLADTGFLYAYSYDDDRAHQAASDAFDLLSKYAVPVYANVISRMEFIDLIFRKQITLGAIQSLAALPKDTKYRNLFNLLKNIRDQNTGQTKSGISYKISERQLKNLRAELDAIDPQGWYVFCAQYAGQKLFNEWTLLEADLGLNFIEVLEGSISPLLSSTLNWTDMVTIMSEHGIRGPDAMVMNLFENSKFPLVLTTDNDFQLYFSSAKHSLSDKAVFLF